MLWDVSIDCVYVFSARGVRTRRQAELRMLNVEVDYFGERVHLCHSEFANKLL